MEVIDDRHRGEYHERATPHHHGRDSIEKQSKNLLGNSR